MAHAIHITTFHVDFIQRLNVGHATYEDIGDGESGPQLSRDFAAEKFAVYVNSDEIVVVDSDGKFLVSFEVMDEIDAVMPATKFVAPNVEVETSHGYNYDGTAADEIWVVKS